MLWTDEHGDIVQWDDRAHRLSSNKDAEGNSVDLGKMPNSKFTFRVSFLLLGQRIQSLNAC